jgi:single-strand DNA-binding protein
MNTSKNKVQLIGHVGKDPVLKTFDKGTQLVNFTLATNEYFKDAQGEKVTQTQWHNIAAWGKKAEILDKYLEKGKEIAIEGRLSSRAYEDAQGQKRYFTEVVVSDFHFISK